MKIKCLLCNKIEQLDDYSFLAKRYRNHPLKTHLCLDCKERIAIKTKARLEKMHIHDEVGH